MSSPATGFDCRMALWGEFFVTGADASIYVAGDTTYGDGAIFRAIGANHGSPTVAVLPIGA